MAQAPKKISPKKPTTMEVEVAKETQDLKVQDNNGKALQKAAPSEQVEMGEQGFDVNDVILPRILLMQAQSDLVAERKAMPGQYVNSLTGEILGDADSPIEFIPLHCPPKTWVTSEKGPRDGKPKFKKIQSETQILEEYGKTNPKDIPWEETLTTGVIRYNKRTLNFYVLIKREVEAGEAFPYLVSFQSTGYKEGKKIATHFMKCGMMKAPVYSRTLKLSSTHITSDQGNYYSHDVGGGQKSDANDIEAAKTWTPIVKSANVKVDAAEKEENASNGAPVSGARPGFGPASASEDDLPY